MKLNALTAVSPLDGRYHSKTSDLAAYFSEHALIRYRLLVEIEYFIECTPPVQSQCEGIIAGFIKGILHFITVMKDFFGTDNVIYPDIF